MCHEQGHMLSKSPCWAMTMRAIRKHERGPLGAGTGSLAVSVCDEPPDPLPPSAHPTCSCDKAPVPSASPSLVHPVCLTMAPSASTSPLTALATWPAQWPHVAQVSLSLPVLTQFCYHTPMSTPPMPIPNSACSPNFAALATFLIVILWYSDLYITFS